MTEPELDIPDLIAYALYDADESASQFDLPLQMFLASLALFESKDPLSADGLFSAVCQLLPSPDIARDAFDRTVKAAVQRGLINRAESGGLSLSPERTSELRVAADKLGRDREQFHVHVRAHVELELSEQLDDEQSQRLEETVERYLQRCFHDQSVELARAFGPDGQGIDASMKGLQQRNLATLVQELVPGSQKLRRSQYQVGVRDGLLTLDESGKSHLAALYHKTVAFALLHQDPTVLKVKRELARRRVVYLDTNVIMAWMFEAHPDHSLACQVVELAASVKCMLMVSKFTLDELELQLRESDDKYRRLAHREGVLAVVNDDVIRSYRRRKDEVPNLTWSVFLANYHPAEAWLRDHGAEIDQRQDWANAVQDERKTRVVEAVGAHKRHSNHPQLVEFDAHNLLYVQLRRKTWPGDAMGSRVWFVTLDRSLSKAEATLVKERIYAVPASHRALAWCEFLGPYAVPASPELEEYVAHLLRSQLGLLHEDPKFVETRFLIKLDETGFDLEEILRAGPERARQVLVSVQESKEVRRLLHIRSDKREPAWGDRFSKAVERALRTVEPDRTKESALELVEQQRDQARLGIESAKRERDQALRQLRQLLGNSQEMESRIRALEERTKARRPGMIQRIVMRIRRR